MYLNSSNRMERTENAIPDLSLQISPPSISGSEAKEFGGVDGGFYLRRGLIHSDRISSDSAGSSCTAGSDLSHENGGFHNSNMNQDLGGVAAAGVIEPTLRLGFDHYIGYNNYMMAATASVNGLNQAPMITRAGLMNHHHQPQKIYGPDFKRSSSRRIISSGSAKRCINRAPRMRWTSTLHSHFIHAVHLLGGHERATPKSVLELMNVKDLTLAHVKSHLQMYRTVKSTDKGSISPSGVLQAQMGLNQNNRGPISNGVDERGKIPCDKSDAIASSYSPIKSSPLSAPASAQNTKLGSWLSSAEANYGTHLDQDGLTSSCTIGTINNQSKENMQTEMKEKGQESSSVGSQSTSSDTIVNLEFTLGRPNWQTTSSSDYAEWHGQIMT